MQNKNSYYLTLIRHGESEWNKDNRFTGWKDVDLSEKGVAEAHEAGRALVREGFDFDLCFCSVLKRALRTLWIVQEEMDRLWLPSLKSWRLNERHYGALTGLNKAETAAKHGEAQVKIWRRSYDTPPPLLEESDPRHPQHDLRYRRVPRALLPSGESLKNTVARVLPFWDAEILPRLIEDEKVLIVAHGNSIRALVKHLEDMTPEQIMEVNIPTGVPLHYELGFEPARGFFVINKRYIGDAEAVAAAENAVAQQGKAHK